MNREKQAKLVQSANGRLLLWKLATHGAWSVLLDAAWRELKRR